MRKIAENYSLPYYTLSPTYSVCKNHGYIAGEHYKCPKCGEVTEVYSRITGYYRPVQNWNVGKTQEFKDRKTYDIGRSHLTHEVHKEECGCCTDNVPNNTDKDVIENATYLFATATCPNCKIACGILDKAGLEVCIITDAPVIPLYYLPLCAGLAVKAGMDEESAWRAITLNPAHVIGIADRVGSLEVGKDADISIFQGNPLRDIQCRTKAVFINGRPVYQA